LEGDTASRGARSDRGGKRDAVIQGRRIRGGSKSNGTRCLVHGLRQRAAGARRVQAVSAVDGGEGMRTGTKSGDGQRGAPLSERGGAERGRAILERDGAGGGAGADRGRERDRAAEGRGIRRRG